MSGRPFEINGVAGHAVELSDVDLARRCTEKLNAAYPGHLWGVHVDSESGLVAIKAFNVSGLYGYRLKIERLHDDPNLRAAVTAGGEILERCGHARGPWKGDMPKRLEGAADKHQPWANGVIF